MIDRERAKTDGDWDSMSALVVRAGRFVIKHDSFDDQLR